MEALLRTSLERVRGQFQKASEDAQPITLLMIESELPYIAPVPLDPPCLAQSMVVASHLPRQYAVPQVSKAGKIVRPGKQRRWYVLASTEVLTIEEIIITPLKRETMLNERRLGLSKQQPWSRFRELAEAAGKLLPGMPKELLTRFPQQTLKVEDGARLWVYALLDLCFQRIPGAALPNVLHQIWKAGTVDGSIREVSWGFDTFDTMKQALTGPEKAKFAPFDETDFPPRHWYAVLPDPFSASVAAIDVLLHGGDRKKSRGVRVVGKAGRPATTAAVADWIHDLRKKETPWKRLAVIWNSAHQHDQRTEASLQMIYKRHYEKETADAVDSKSRKKKPTQSEQ